MRESVLELFPQFYDERQLEAGHDAARSQGFQRLDLGATLPGVALYRAFGFREVEPFVVTMPDGVTIEAVAMERPIDPA